MLLIFDRLASLCNCSIIVVGTAISIWEPRRAWPATVKPVTTGTVPINIKANRNSFFYLLRHFVSGLPLPQGGVKKEAIAA